MFESVFEAFKWLISLIKESKAMGMIAFLIIICILGGYWAVHLSNDYQRREDECRMSLDSLHNIIRIQEDSMIVRERQIEDDKITLMRETTNEVREAKHEQDSINAVIRRLISRNSQIIIQNKASFSKLKNTDGNENQ